MGGEGEYLQLNDEKQSRLKIWLEAKSFTWRECESSFLYKSRCWFENSLRVGHSIVSDINANKRASLCIARFLILYY